MPLAYHITWHTYGSWLPGDDKGWVKRDVPGIQPPDSELRSQVEDDLAHERPLLTDEQRAIVEETIREECRIRSWTLHAVNVRSNHVHIVVSSDRKPEEVMHQLKSWSSRKLNEQVGAKTRWWAYHGSTKWIVDQAYLANAIRYVLERQ
ncbi:MAG: transposase [Planctomycetia bacterium]|nr:transposase [Planctomycetia bacterium]